MAIQALDVFKECTIPEPFSFECFGRADDKLSGFCAYVYDEAYVHQLNSNLGVVGVVTTEAISKLIDQRIKLVIADKPASTFFSAYNAWVERKEAELGPSSVDNSCIIEAGALIAKKGVAIGKRTLIEAGAIIKPGVTIGEDCVIRSGAVIGGHGFEVKTIDGRSTVVPHGDRVEIGNNVEIQYNSCVDRGFLGRSTKIGDNVKIDNLVHVAHGVHIGNSTKIAAGSIIAGRSNIGNFVWIGPGCTISNAISICDNASITLGSAVVSNVRKPETYTGYFAIEHGSFIAAWKRFRASK